MVIVAAAAAAVTVIGLKVSFIKIDFFPPVFMILSLVPN